MEELAGQSALVTGASRGIGRSIALLLSAAGMRVGLVARSTDLLDALADEISASGGAAVPLPCDICKPERIGTVVEACVQELGGVDLLVNNAGVFLESQLEDLEVSDWEHVLRVNVTAPFLFAKAIIPHMAKRGRGRIINIGSTAGKKGYLYQTAYCVSKHALLGLSRCLAIEAEPFGVSVNTLCPGGVRTDLIAGTHLAKRLVGERMLEPEDVAESVVFLARQSGNVDIPELVMLRGKGR
ncbi:MAG: SDR family oxidoreductase [Lentisphaerae bacterium]|jgi:3-oxoacyl-[acyl-carrier protein] reductase|nr:SDR family oxidoreductase [Lentisphaerota bacterium]MBT4822478.1 SDR family oxidoreductase [Lentisphaerota bacterium]MBT5611420.1 SDR family oxidoreductase [Lentisphaerota bacterium]MBT7059649.1 SDR family oxidoreductase [Lentisphaerota bacterium]MBT7846877.1 SDR family oxidoreductase [Lentisphaerota bacterium]